MSWAYTAVMAAVTVGSTLYQAKEQRKAQNRARKDALEDEAQARRAAVFAETEGEGLGSLGKVQLAIDEDITELEQLRKQGKVRASI